MWVTVQVSEPIKRTPATSWTSEEKEKAERSHTNQTALNR